MNCSLAVRLKTVSHMVVVKSCTIVAEEIKWLFVEPQVGTQYWQNVDCDC